MQKRFVEKYGNIGRHDGVGQRAIIINRVANRYGFSRKQRIGNGATKSGFVFPSVAVSNGGLLYGIVVKSSRKIQWKCHGSLLHVIPIHGYGSRQ